jgi:hypothetical protein
MGREHAVVEHQVVPGPRDERRELLEQRERLEDQMARAIRLVTVQREHDAAIGEPPKPILRHRRPNGRSRRRPTS